MPSIIGIRDPGALTLVQTLLCQGITVRVRVSGNSMQPLLQGGEIVEIEPLQKVKSLQLGDILFLCDRYGNPLVHRLIWRRSRNGQIYFLTKGDACMNFDGFISRNNIVGRVQQVFLDIDTFPIRLNTPLLKLQASLIVSRTLISHAFRKIVHNAVC
jgi:signal peptidase I